MFAHLTRYWAQVVYCGEFFSTYHWCMPKAGPGHHYLSAGITLICVTAASYYFCGVETRVLRVEYTDCGYTEDLAQRAIKHSQDRDKRKGKDWLNGLQRGRRFAATQHRDHVIMYITRRDITSRWVWSIVWSTVSAILGSSQSLWNFRG